MKRGYARRQATLRGKERAIRSGRPYLFEPCWTCASPLRLAFYLLLMMFDGVITRNERTVAARVCDPITART